MATFDLGRVTPLYKGDYSASASYELNDVVLYNGNLYWHVQATATVGILPTDTTVWKLAFADEGVRAEIRGYADNAQASADSASASKSAAATSASQASASASQAVLSAQTAQTAETGAVSNAQTASTKASEATVSAQSAASSAQTATDKATIATNKAQAASESASLATAKASAAATSETNAAASATTATTKASEAAASATSAQEYDESAQQSAINAQTSATNAAASAVSAQGYSEAAAQSAEDAAESASRAEAFYYLPTDTTEGAIATFTDGADNVPVKSLVVDIDHVQDLHGYENPWPAGGGKNLFGLSDFTDTYYGVTYEYESLSGKLSTNGTCTAGAGTNVGEITVPEGTYTFSADFTNASGFAQIFLRDKATNANVEEIRTDRPQRTVTLNGTYYIRIAAQAGSVNSGYINNIQLELGESKTNFAPYSNICPITGWTGANINKSGINIWDEETELGNVSSTTGAKFNANNRIRTKNYIPVVPGAQYKIVYPMTGTIGTVAFYDSGKNFVSALFPSANAVITAPSNAYYMLIGFATGYGVTYNHDISINYPSTDTAYHPYSGESVDISFPTEAGTVYGGSLDVTNGVLTVDRAMVTFDGSNDEGWQKDTAYNYFLSSRITDVKNENVKAANFASNLYKYAEIANRFDTIGACLIWGYVRVRLEDMSMSLTEWKAYLAETNLQVVYPLATPITYQLTPTEVKSLLGANNIWADTGDANVVYRADTSAYIAKKIAEAISALS